MPTDQNQNLEYLVLKVFLYKFTPNFTLTESAGTTLFKIDRYAIDLDETFYTKYDITPFVVKYTFDQTITDNTFNWSLTLNDQVLSLQDINTRLLVHGQTIRSTPTGILIGDNVFDRLGQYESLARNFVDKPFILNAKKQRGQQANQLTNSTIDPLPFVNGLRLSDLIQDYDVVSCFLYKSTTTDLNDLQGFIGPDTMGLSRFVVQPVGGTTLTPSNLQSETILLSPYPNITSSSTLFSNEFNGFVMSRTTSQQVGGVDLVSLSGNGISRIFGSTRRLIKSSLFQNSIYDVAEIPDAGGTTPFENIYATRRIPEIFIDLFDLVYRINFDNTLRDTNQNITNAGTSFYNITEMQAGNEFQVNSFTIPPFLLSLVMRDRGFNYKQPTDIDTFLATVENTAANQISTVVQSAPQTQVTNRVQPVRFSTEINTLIPYFRFIEDSLKFFNAELRTPFEIIDELKSKTYIEFFETPEGVLVIRTPAYNDISTTIFSSSLDIISQTYNSRVDGLVARQRLGYKPDLLPNGIVGLNEYAYTNGKLLIQYGFLETTTDANPNVINDKVVNQSGSNDSTQDNTIFAYCEYFLRIYDASLKTGTIVSDMDPRIRVGVTYFDEKNNKFGYITNVTKDVSVAGTATMTFSLSYVRDAYLDDPTDLDADTLNFENLLRLQDVAAASDPTITIIEDPVLPELLRSV